MRTKRWYTGIALLLLAAFPFQAMSTISSFLQTSWSGGATANTATHTTDQTGWTEYSTKDALLSVANSGADLQLATTTTTLVQTNNGTTNTGFNLTGTATSSTEVVGDGSTATVRLDGFTTFGDNVTVDSTGSVGWHSAIALDSDDNAHISYQLDDSPDNLRYATNESGSWVTTAVDTSGFNGTWNDIAIDSTGEPHISYSDTGPVLGYASHATGAWVLTTNLDSGGASTSIVLDGSDKVHISYQDGNSDLKYLTNASGSWASTTLDGSTPNTGGYTSIAIDSAGKIHISYYDGNGGDLEYATDASGSWATTTLDSAGNVGGWTSLAIDSDDNLHISYHDFSNASLKYATCSSSCILPGSWTKTTVDDSSSKDLGQESSLALDAGDEPHIVYYDATDGDLEFASHASGSWATSTLASVGTGAGRYTDIAIGSDDYDQISYFDNSGGIQNLIYLTEALTYPSSGTYTSGPINLGAGALTWGTFSWTSSTGQTITLKARSSATGAFVDGDDTTAWSGCTSLTSGALLSTGGCVTDGHDYIQYQAALSTADTTTTPSLDDVTIQYTTYPASKMLVSSPFNTESSTSAMDSVAWVEDTSLPTNTSVAVALRTASTSAGLSSASWNTFTNATSNCTKSTGTVTCPASALATGLKDATEDQWFQYRVTLETSDGGSTPTVGQVQVGYIRDASVVPVLTTEDAVSLAETTATLNGNITGTGGTDITVRGFAYGTNPTMTTVIATTTDTVGQPFSTGAFEEDISGLSCDVTYYVRAYATNTAGTGYGSIEYFGTSCPDEGGNNSGSSGGSSGGGARSAPPTVSPASVVPPGGVVTPPAPGGGTDEPPTSSPPSTEPPAGGGSGGSDGGAGGGAGGTGPGGSSGGGDSPGTGEPPGVQPPEDTGGFIAEIIEVLTPPLESLESIVEFSKSSARRGAAIVASTTAQVIPLAIPLGALTGTLTFVGTALPVASGASLAFSLARLWHLLLSALGFRRRRPWGVVYDSVTKHPVDPDVIRLTDEYGAAVQTTYTDLDGRYGFLVPPGTYRIEIEKKNYIFPSTRLHNSTSDGLYDHLYTGGPVTVTGEPTLILNIPLDPVSLDWSEFNAQSSKKFSFYSERDRIFSFIARWIFRLGFIAALYALVTTPSVMDASIVGLYLVIGVLRLLGIGPRPYGYLTNIKTGTPFAFALVTVRDALTKQEITHTVADQKGRYYALVPDGDYVVEIARKELDESYTQVYTSPVLAVTHGVINQSFGV